MQPALAKPVSKGTLWTTRVVGGLAVLFLLFDATIHTLVPPAVVQAFAQINMPVRYSPIIGIVEFISLALYLIPRTALLGTVLWTGYLGGAIVTNLHTPSPAFGIVFALVVAVMLWAPRYLLDERLRDIFPVRRVG